MPVYDELKGKNVPIKLWAPVRELESEALDQLKNVAALPWVFHHVALMPDGHVGKGATIGSVVAMKNAVAPSAVGVDIGCGMAAMRTNLDPHKVDRKLKEIRTAIEAAIPVGFNGHESRLNTQKWPYLHQKAVELFGTFAELDRKVQRLDTRAHQQLGTLGGGNHFIELCLDTEQHVWMMLHSGSRNIGKELAEIHIARAKELTHNKDLPDKNLAVFLAGTPEMVAYRNDLFWAQRYAALNREVMLQLYLDVLTEFWPSIVHDMVVLCHHNYVSVETHFDEEVLVTRKGAIRAGIGEMGIIPGSMGTKSYIVRGLGNPESFQSASHGAGRKMSRGAAKKKFTREDLIEQTKGVECRKDTGVLDEIPGAYKNIDRVMENQKDLVEVVAELKQVVVVKG